jgi:serine protease Do
MKHLIKFMIFCVLVVNLLFIAIYREEIIDTALTVIESRKLVKPEEEEQPLNDTMTLQIEGMIEEQTENRMTDEEVNQLIEALLQQLKGEMLTTQSTLDTKLNQIESAIANLEPQLKLALYQELKEDLTAEFSNEIATMEFKNFEEMLVNLSEIHLASVVGVSNEKRGIGNQFTTNATGSGVIFHKNNQVYYVITNEHVVHQADRVSVYIEGLGSIPADVVGSDSTIDLALLRFSSSKNLTVSSFTTTDDLKQGQIVVAMGNPFGYDLYQSVTMGIISGLHRDVTVPHDDQTGYYTWVDGIIQHDAPISPGNSGGPLFDLNGNVIGINNAINSEDYASNIGFAIPSNTVITFINRYFNYSVE